MTLSVPQIDSFATGSALQYDAVRAIVRQAISAAEASTINSAAATTASLAATPIDISLRATGGKGTAVDPWVGWDTAITWTANTAYRAPAGSYSYTTSPVFGVAGIKITGDGIGTVFTCTGTTDCFSVVSTAAISGVILENFVITGTSALAAGSHGLKLKNLSGCRFSNIRVRSAGTSGAGFYLENVQDSQFDHPTCNSNYGAFGSKPLNGILLSSASGANTVNTFITPDIVGVGGDGILIQNSSFGNTFTSGSSQGNTGRGVNLAAGSYLTTFIGLDCESNSGADDILCAADMNYFIGCRCASGAVTNAVHFAFGSGVGRWNQVIGGSFTKVVLVDASCLGIAFENIKFAAAFTDNGTGTRTRSCYDITNAKFLQDQNYNTSLVYKGANIASAATIAPAQDAGNVFHITGVTTINTITARGTGDWLLLIADGAWALGSAGNIKATARVMVINDVIYLAYDGTNWYEIAAVDTSPVSQTPVGVTRLINTTAPVAGGGNLSADRTISVAITTTNDGGAIVKQATTPGTQQTTANLNISGTAKVGAATVAGARASGANETILRITDPVTGAQTAGFGERIQWESNAGGSIAAIGFEVGATGTNNESQIRFYTQASAGGGLKSAMLVDSAQNVYLAENTATASTAKLGGTVFTQTADATTTANTLTTLFGTGVGSLTLPANLLIAGRMIRLTLGGYVSAATVAGTHTLTLLLGGVSVATGTSLAALTSTLNGGWQASGIITCRTTGAGGTVVGGAFLGFASGATDVVTDAANTTTAAANTTGTLAVDLQLNNGAAAGTYTTQYCAIEILN